MVPNLDERMAHSLKHLSSPSVQGSDHVVVPVLQAAEAVVLKSRSRMMYSLALEKPIWFAPSVFWPMEAMTSRAASPSRSRDILEQRWEDSRWGCTACLHPQTAVSSRRMLRRHVVASSWSLKLSSLIGVTLAHERREA